MANRKSSRCSETAPSPPSVCGFWRLKADSGERPLGVKAGLTRAMTIDSVVTLGAGEHGWYAASRDE